MYSFRSVPGGIPPVFMRGAGGGPYNSALSGIEMALWDLAGKALGLPVYRLMGGRVRDKVAVYFDIGEPKRAAEVVKSTGVRAIKDGAGAVITANNPTIGLDPGKDWNFTLTARQIDAVAANVATMREALGPDIGLAMDFSTRFDTESAIQIAKALEPYHLMWIEEPIPSDNVDAMAKVRNHSRVPIACGENVYTRFGFRQFLEKQAVSIIQPDMAKTGGLWETRKIASMAEVYHIPIAPHGVASPLGQTAYAQVCATVPNFLILEWGHLLRNKELNSLMRNLPEYEDGYVRVSEAPGIGIELNDDAIRERLLPGYKTL
jgi:galactonate dehydratase